MRLTPDQRHSLVNAIRRGIDKKLVANVFNTTVKTVIKWCKRAFHKGRESFKDKSRKSKKSKITLKVELSILALRNSFKWGTARIQQGLICLPGFMRKVLGFEIVQGIEISRTAINNMLKKHGINGYEKNYEKWKFFRAKTPNELWQLDIKGPFTVKGQKYWFVICIDDYSRYLLLAEQLDHDPTTEEITELLGRLKNKPRKILTDYGKQFREKWKDWCKEKNIEHLFAHPYYPQDKGKVERTIRNINEEFIHLLRKFPDWIKGNIKVYKNWFNNKRFHRGINDYPARLFREVGKFT